jgi:hypothetical protein
VRRRRREGTGAIVRAIEAQGDRIVAAIERASAAARESRESVIKLGAEILRDVLEEGARRAIVVDPGTGRSVTFAANDAADAPPESSPPESTPRPSR